MSMEIRSIPDATLPVVPIKTLKPESPEDSISSHVALPSSVATHPHQSETGGEAVVHPVVVPSDWAACGGSERDVIVPSSTGRRMYAYCCPTGFTKLGAVIIGMVGPASP